MGGKFQCQFLQGTELDVEPGDFAGVGALKIGGDKVIVPIGVKSPEGEESGRIEAMGFSNPSQAVFPAPAA